MTQSSPDAKRRNAAICMMKISGYSSMEIAQQFNITRSRVDQILDRNGEPPRSRRSEIPDDPEWYFARALLGCATTAEEMSVIWQRYRLVWTDELTKCGKAILREVAEIKYREKFPPPQKYVQTYFYEDLVIAHEQGRLVHAWE